MLHLILLALGGWTMTNAPMPVEANPSVSEGWYRASFSPDGSKVAFTYNKGQDVFLTIRDASTLLPVVAEQRVNVDPYKEQNEQEVDWSADGICVVWSDRYGHYANSMASVARVFDHNGVPLTGDIICHPTYLPNTAWLPRLSALRPEDGGGWAVVSSVDWDESVVMSVVQPDGTLSVTDAPVAGVGDGERQNVAAIATLPSGNLLVTYSDFKGTPTPADVKAIIMSPTGAPVIPPMLLGSNVADDLSWCAVNPHSGGVGVVWRGGGQGGQLRTYETGAGAGMSNIGVWWVPKIAYDVRGTRMTAWENQSQGTIHVGVLNPASGSDDEFVVGGLGSPVGQGDRRMPGIAMGKGSACNQMFVTYSVTGPNQKLDAYLLTFEYVP